MLYNVLPACCPWTECCRSVLNPIACFFVQCLWVYFPNHMKSKGIFFHHQQVLITSHEHDLIQVVESSWYNMKNSVQKTSHSRNGIHKEKGKLYGGQGEQDGLRAKVHTKKIPKKSKVEWIWVKKNERTLSKIKNSFVLVWGGSNPDWSMTKISFYRWSPSFQKTGELGLPSFRRCHKLWLRIHPSHQTKQVCQSGWYYILSYRREVNLYYYLILLTFELLSRLYCWLKRRQNCLSIYCHPQERERLWNNCLYQHKG